MAKKWLARIVRRKPLTLELATQSRRRWYEFLIPRPKQTGPRLRLAKKLATPIPPRDDEEENPEGEDPVSDNPVRRRVEAALGTRTNTEIDMTETPSADARGPTMVLTIGGTLLASVVIVGFGLMKGRPTPSPEPEPMAQAADVPTDRTPAASVPVRSGTPSAPPPIAEPPSPSENSTSTPAPAVTPATKPEPSPDASATSAPEKVAATPAAPTPAQAQTETTVTTTPATSATARTPSAVPVSHGTCKTSCTLGEVDGRHLVTCSYGRWVAGTLTPNTSGPLKGCLAASQLTPVDADGS